MEKFLEVFLDDNLEEFLRKKNLQDNPTELLKKLPMNFCRVSLAEFLKIEETCYEFLQNFQK